MVRESQRLSKSLSSFQSARAWGRLGAKSPLQGGEETWRNWNFTGAKLKIVRIPWDFMGFKISCILIQLMLLVPCGIPLQFAFLKPMARERFDDLPFWKVVHLLHSYFRLPEGIPIGSERFSPRLRWICRRHNLEEHICFFWKTGYTSIYHIIYHMAIWYHLLYIRDTDWSMAQTNLSHCTRSRNSSPSVIGLV